MEPIELLRRLLDERGVEHTDAEDGHTQHTWWSDGDHEIAACNSGERLAVYNLTPEQAIAATLGLVSEKGSDSTDGMRSCPFCGCTEVRTEFIFPDEGDDWKIAYSMACDRCHASTSFFTKEEEAKAAWNRRAQAGEV